MHHSSILNIDLDGLDDEARQERLGDMLAGAIAHERLQHPDGSLRTDVVKGAHTTVVRAWTEPEGPAPSIRALGEAFSRGAKGAEKVRCPECRRMQTGAVR